MVGNYSTRGLGNFKLAFLEQAGNKFGMMNNLKLSAKPGIFILDAVIAMGTGGDYLLHIIAIKYFYVLLRLALEQVFVAQATGGFTTAALLGTQDTEINTGQF